MKKNFTLMIVLLFATIANAQYQFPELGNGNPGGLNKDSEYPEGGGQPAGWTAISTTTNSTPVWSNVVNLPFSFDFNGSTQTAFKVSTSGVLTFSTATVSVPGPTPAILPSGSIPSNSIVCWGLSGRGSNDKIFTKTFGSAPNRQLWIQFNSFSLPNPASSQCYTYFSIVLEETTNKFYIVDQRNNGCAHALTIGWQVSGSSAFSFAGSPSINKKSGADPTDKDNYYFGFTPGVSFADDLGVLKINAPKFAANNSTITIGADIINQGNTTVNSFDLKYQVDGGAVQTMSVSNASIQANGGQYTATHNIDYSITTLNTKKLKVWIEAAGNQNIDNDTAYQDINVLAFIPTKRVVFEEATGTWCGWCPRGAVYMDSLHKIYPTTAMLVAVHNADPMVVPVYDGSIAGYIAGYPSGLVDRKGGEYDPSEFFTEYSKRIVEVAPCDVNVEATYNSNTRVMDITTSATFASDANGDFRFNVVVVEDGVKGTSSGYNQVNYYSGGANGPMGNYHNLPSTVPAAQMVYDHVARAILGDWMGTVSSIPNAVNANSTHNYNYSYTLPANVNPDKVHVIAWVSDASTGEILNANEKNFATGISTKKAESFLVKAFPNPSNGITTFEIKSLKPVIEAATLEIYDVTGRLIYTSTDAKINGGSQFFVWNSDENVANGIYQATIKIGSEIISTKIVLTR